MNRRNLIKGMGVVALYSSFPVVVSEFLSSCNSKDKELRAGFFSDDEFNLVKQIADTLLPVTSTPGASEVHVPYFIELVVKDCMGHADQQLIKKGLQQLNDQQAGKFSSITAEEKLKVIKETDTAAFDDDADKRWFRLLKKLAVVGYFTSQEGMTKALHYVKVPGDYKACIPVKKGEKSMAKTFLMYW
jgi:hypothetical protein